MNYDEILLNDSSKKSFILGLIRLAKADGVISDEERQYFVGSAGYLSLSENDISIINNAIISDDDIVFDFESPLEKVFFFREGIQLCAVDTKYDDAERAEIRKMAAELSVPLKIIESIEAWVEEGMSWRSRGDDLLSSCASELAQK